MEEIKVGEYVRTANGQIAKLIEPTIYEMENGKCIEWLEDIVKYSLNIIDLIEVGDYVNGKEVHKYNGNIGVISINTLGWTFIAFKDGTYPIETIVTKEQFASMEYRLED